MRFWDTSALLPLLVAENTTAEMAKLLRKDNDMVVWWATEIESVSAIARLERQGALGSDAVEEVLNRLDALKAAWYEVGPADILRSLARRLLRTHALRAVDALQLAAAIVASEMKPATLELICLDERLRCAARREGFPVLPA